MVFVEADAPPPPHRGKGPTRSPKPWKVAKVAAQPPPEAPDVEALGASVATHVTDACQVLVEQAAATVVEAALAMGRSADHKRGEEVEAQRRRGGDLQQRRGFAEAQVRTLTSTWCSIQVVRPQGTDTMGLHAHLPDGAPMALIVCVGSFTGGDSWVESGGLLNPSLREKRRHTRVCKGRAVEGWACKATPQAPCFVCSILPVLHFLRFDLCVL